MRKKFAGVLLLFLVPAALLAQAPSNDDGVLWGGRFGVEATHRIDRRWRVDGGVEGRISDNLGFDERLVAGGGIRYSPDKQHSLGVEYHFVGKREYRSDLSYRNRFSFYGLENWKAGPWRISLKEEIRLRNRPGGINPYKHARNEVFSLTRVKAGYRLNRNVTPYLALEGRLLLNGPSVTGYVYNPDLMRYTTPDGAVSGEEGWFFQGYKNCYFNRCRIEAGTDFRKLKSGNAIRLYVLADHSRDFHVGTADGGTTLTGLWWDRTWRFSFGFRYTFDL